MVLYVKRPQTHTRKLFLPLRSLKIKVSFFARFRIETMARFPGKGSNELNSIYE